ncbi:sulfotransferase family 2 domain-containing protein [Siccirubricoccus sp. G192]|uniref:sulfotransferase family 2 domain-containing protein n=1 Tax=Siccirubricoccus sp. G192 TaxID=2849651 RepID=UPI001C2C0B49|nr:sulfotransferase family 2 domain-containing protein [Siccirubricoccus sp. G192]MBV1799397.1 sulfotransferase family 2 domain-containing protein [Siccirubricoccus sp. G192]
MLGLLFEKQFDEYFAAFRQDLGLLVFSHVPKTAGSSLRAEIARVLKPEANIFLDYNDKTRTYMQGLDDAVAAFLERHRKLPHRFASGHIFAHHVDAIAREAGSIRRVTMLRQPVKRVVSDYRYQCSPMHPGNEEFRRRCPTFGHYLQRVEEANKATRYLVPHALFQSGDQEACLDYMLRTYDFIGMQEMYPLSFRMLFALIGQPRAPTLRMRVNDGDEAAELAADPQVLREVEDRNALDLGIYNAMLARWRSVRDPLLDYLATLPAQPGGL